MQPTTQMIQMTLSIRRRYAVVLLLCMFFSTESSMAADFVRTGDLLQGRDMPLSANLSGGRVLVTGGVGLSDDGVGVFLASAEIFDPVIDGFVPTGPMQDGRDGNATITRLTDGRILVTGGVGQDNDGQYIALASAEVYDPASGRFERTANDLSSVRYFHTATLLNDGRVLITGGWGAGVRLSSAEIYDPSTRRFTTTGSMAAERNGHTATRLDNGKILVAGGLTTDAEVLSSAELYDPATGTFSSTGGLADPRFMATSSRLEDGRVLVAGGLGNGIWRPYGEVYDPGTGRFTSTGPLQSARYEHAQTTLADGRVAITAGDSDLGPMRLAERFDPATGVFTAVANMRKGRLRSAAALLPDGRILVAGGMRPWEAPLSVAEIYTPVPGPYADLAVRLQAPDGGVQPGRNLSYSVQIENKGSETAENVVVDIELPAALSFRQVRVRSSELGNQWRCVRKGSALSCSPASGTLHPAIGGQHASRHRVAVRIDMSAPRSGVLLPAASTAIASTTTAEDITANNEAHVFLNADATTMDHRRTGATDEAALRLRRMLFGGIPMGGRQGNFESINTTTDR